MSLIKFEWVDFYTEFATKLLSYKNDRTSLIAKIQNVYKEIDMKFPKMESDGTVIDIDPFTVFALFNKGIKDENRKRILGGIAKEFNIEKEIPCGFDGIPLMNNQRATFFNFVEYREEKEIDNLWDIFEAAIMYAENPNAENKIKVESTYDKVIQQKGIRWNITMGLYWIRPNIYVNLDSKNREFIITEKLLSKELIQEINEFKDMISGENYIKICDLLLDKIKDGKYEYTNFPELSFAAWTAISYWPSLDEYNPNISSDEWVEFLKQDSKEHPEVLDMLKAMFDLGGEATCKKVGEILDKHPTSCNSIGKNLGKRAKNRFNLAPCMDGEIERFFVIPFVGRYIYQNGTSLYSWKIRPELKEALESMDLDEVKIYKEETTDISKNTILYGPPGTGKTYNTVIYAVAIIENKKIEQVKMEDYTEVINRYNKYKKQGLIEFTTFHQSYGYEDFIEGIRPIMNNNDDGQNDIQYEINSGLFKSFCDKAGSNILKQEKNYVFIIDEINRGNISKIFGELITLIEPTKRIGQVEEMKVRLPYSQQLFGVPNNVYIIGTMNTADRSIATIDTALRRRFYFKEMLPNAEVLDGVYVEDVSIKDMLIKMNKRITVLFDREHTLGHAYFLPLKENPKIETLASIFENSVIPLLQEYFYEDYEKIRLVLGDNQKDSVDKQFIIVEENDYNELFGYTDYEFDEMKIYKINTDALKNIEAYRFI